LRAENKI
jgi:hypothetical protein